MDSFSIGISGLKAAQKAFDIIGNNVANAATDGYHRQRIELRPAYSGQVGSILLGGGVEVAGITRLIDGLLEQEILRQKSLLGQVSQEFATLRTVENAFGEFLEGTGLSTAMDNFFNALQDLSAHPTEIIWQNQIVTIAKTMAGQFRTLGEFLTSLKNQIELEAKNTIEQINILTNRIAELNDNIEKQEISGGQANNLRDQRDQSITELSELVGIETQARQYGVIDVYVAGTSVVIGATAIDLEVGLKEEGKLGISVAGANNFNINVQGGRLGGLLSLRNELVSDIHDDLDDLATAMIQQINQYHVQGVGSTGSFTDLTGWPVTSEDLADFDPPVSDGTIYIRVTNTSTGTVTRTAVPINASTDSLTTIATAITAITGLSASVVSSKLHIQADTNYKFDFLPAVLPEPTASTLTGSPPSISVSGIYTGTANDTFQFTVVGTGSVGNGTLQLEVRNGAAELVSTLNVGSGYAAGDKLDIGNGIKISLSTGDLNAGETFDVDAFADTDTSGVLAAIGINTFFSGSSALDIAVRSDIAATPGRVASALGADMTDNTNASRMAGLKDQTVTSLNSMTPGEFYRQMVTNIGQQLFVKQARKDNIESMVQNLGNQQGEISGVNINDEAAKMLIFEQMFKAMAKYLSTIQSSLATLMELL
ncbi:MAG: flagellar hook-associated protein FlgK [Planctomycetes bacterium]|nr:flagellar hook-associated protein FlgK [Planctomycetota bacterium]MCH8118451.1 flagellar hook-associated protein FlgK [Planctomycetota bacterium]